jgi:hypothetical protein
MPVVSGRPSGVQKISQDEDVRRLAALIAALETRIRDEFLAAIERLRGSVDVRALADALAAGQIDRALAILSDQLIARGFDPLRAAIVNGMIAAAQSTALAVSPLVVPALGSVEVRFDVLNPRTAAFLNRYAFDLIQRLSAETRQTVKEVITAGVTAGENPRDVARDVRQTIGLLPRQEAAVQNYRRLLNERSAEALTRALRDRRFDATLRRAMRTGKPIAADKIDRMVERYRARYLKYRSEVIARTEAARANAVGNHAMWQQQIDQGLVTEDRILRKWVYTADGRVRHAHATIPTRNPRGVGFAQPFDTELGPLLFPGDPNAAPANTIQCRCTVIYRVLPPGQSRRP